MVAISRTLLNPDLKMARLAVWKMNLPHSGCVGIIYSTRNLLEVSYIDLEGLDFEDLYGATYPSVVMVTMVYQNAAGILVNLLAVEPFSA
ncbi:hypothetical protein EYF80_007733 [Liparis tanakae]|uniref:Uncharacterized protein n=1 Tax=Liparis tanakae TaxID=230148 RepID=A0A4Z2IWF0_9TELE|nr:hypothetical protein EYF80_007733 [Liparis tanakae]